MLVIDGEEIKKPDTKGEFSPTPDATQIRPAFSRSDLGAGN